MSDIETVIAQHEQLLPELEQSVTELSAQVGDLQEEMKALETKIQENILEIGRLKEELLKLESQDSQNLNQEISTLQQQIQDFFAQRAELETLAAQNSEQIQTLEKEIQEYQQRLSILEETEGAEEIQQLQSSITVCQDTIRQLSFTVEITELDAQIQQFQTQLHETEAALAASETSPEGQEIRLQILMLENENIALQQKLDGYRADPAIANLESYIAQRDTCAQQLQTAYDQLSATLEQMDQTEAAYQQALENQSEDNEFSDYHTNNEVAPLNETIAKASRNVQLAQEKLNRLEQLAENPVLYAQLDGVVTALNYQVGDTISNGKPLCILGELQDITLTVPVSAADIGSVSPGQKVDIYMDAYAEQKFTGTVTERFLVANDNGDYPVTISIEPGEQMLLPGMKAYVTIILKEKIDVLTLSNKAITLENGQQYVLVQAENGELVRKQVVTGFSDGRISEILDGLTENEVVFVQE